ncbi:amidohydrolase family protein, partial [Cetobacterium sp.]
MKQILIKNAYVVSMNEKREIYNNGSILIENDLIKAIGKVDEKSILDTAEIIDAKGKIILPGLINTHVH